MFLEEETGNRVKTHSLGGFFAMIGGELPRSVVPWTTMNAAETLR
jgi:hypothetical protein